MRCRILTLDSVSLPRRLLHPDHGYPVRLIVPGSIGGRMIKWLHEIKVTADESDNWYHFYDNRVLPSHLNAETAEAEGAPLAGLCILYCFHWCPAPGLRGRLTHNAAIPLYPSPLQSVSYEQQIVSEH